jgi:hydrogenase nickel incorporation protein HypB
MSQTRLIQLEADIMGKNAIFATANRDRFSASGILALNLVSSPGSGKTTLLCRTLTEIAGEFPVAVIEGDQQTSADADRIRATGAPAIQINTGKGCHLDGHMVGHAVEHLAPAEGSVLFIENVGNLVCPAAFDLGEGRAWRSFPSPRARTNRSNIPICLPAPIWFWSTRSIFAASGFRY